MEQKKWPSGCMNTFFFLGDHLVLAGKTVRILAKIFFVSLGITRFWPEKPFEFWRRTFFVCFWRSPGFERKKASI